MADINYTTLDWEHCKKVADLLAICFPDMPIEDQYTQEELEEVAEVFPEGTIVALHGEQVVGMGTGIFTDLNFEQLPMTENELLYKDNEVINHDSNGDYYYGSDMAVHPQFRGRGIGRQIYNRRKAVVTDNNKLGFAAAAVLPGYSDYKRTHDIHTYLEMVKRKEVFDPTLSMQIRNGFQVIKPIKDFFTYPQSDNWAALILWENPNLVVDQS